MLFAKCFVDLHIIGRIIVEIDFQENLCLRVTLVKVKTSKYFRLYLDFYFIIDN